MVDVCAKALLQVHTITVSATIGAGVALDGDEDARLHLLQQPHMADPFEVPIVDAEHVSTLGVINTQVATKPRWRPRIVAFGLQDFPALPEAPMYKRSTPSVAHSEASRGEVLADTLTGVAAFLFDPDLR
jgi:hypothetical protein